MNKNRNKKVFRIFSIVASVLLIVVGLFIRNGDICIVAGVSMLIASKILIKTDDIESLASLVFGIIAIVAGVIIGVSIVNYRQEQDINRPTHIQPLATTVEGETLKNDKEHPAVYIDPPEDFFASPTIDVVPSESVAPSTYEVPALKIKEPCGGLNE